MKKFFMAVGIVNAICLITLILFMGIRLPAFGMWFYRWHYRVNNTYERVNMKPENLHEVTQHMIQYLQGHEPYLQIMTKVDGVYRYFFSKIEIRHLLDVYDLFAIGFTIQNILITLFLLTLGLFLLGDRKQIAYLFRSWQIGATITLLSLLTLAIIIAINWHRAFVIFHQIFFDNDYWMLDRQVDLLINIVPYEFFIAASIFVGSFLAIGMLILFLSSSLVLRKIH